MYPLVHSDLPSVDLFWFPTGDVWLPRTINALTQGGELVNVLSTWMMNRVAKNPALMRAMISQAIRDHPAQFRELEQSHGIKIRDPEVYGDDYDFDTLQSLGKLVRSVAIHLRSQPQPAPVSQPIQLRTSNTTHFAGSVNMTNVGCNTRSTSDIIQAQRGDERVLLEQ